MRIHLNHSKPQRSGCFLARHPVDGDVCYTVDDTFATDTVKARNGAMHGASCSPVNEVPSDLLVQRRCETSRSHPDTLQCVTQEP